MLARLKACRWACAYLLFVALIGFSLRDVLSLPGTIGHSWDWEISAFAPQIWGRLSHDLFVWDYQIRAGYYNLFRTNGWYSFLALPFSFLGGEIFSRLFIVAPMLLAAVCMCRLARESLGLNSPLSTAAGILYMLSPIVFSRILTGHTLLFAYALLPLAILYLHRTLADCGQGRFSWREAVIAGLLLGAQGIHPSMMVLASVVVGLLVLFAFLRTHDFRKTLQGAVVVLAIFALLNAYWALPMGAGYLSTGTLYHSGSVVDTPDQVSASTVIDQRESLFLSSQQPIQESLRQNAAWGYDTEFDYPVPEPLAPLWLIVSYLIPLAAFATLLKRQSRDLYLVLAISGLFGATLVSASLIPPGAAIYQWLMLHAFPVWAEFGNSVRALPLVSLAYSALAPALLQQLPSRLGQRGRRVVAGLGALALLVYVTPFLVGTSLINPHDGLTVKAYQPSSTDRQLYDFLQADQADFRITYVPPPWIFHPENYELGYEWIGGVSPHPEFFVPYFNPAMWARASDFRADIPPSLSGKLLGLAAVKYVVYPRTRFINPAQGISPPPVQAAGNNVAWARFTDEVLSTQKDLDPVTVPFTATIVLRNQDYMPHIYAAAQATLVEGDSNALPAFADSTFFSPRPAIFFQAQQDPLALDRLAGQVGRVVNTLPPGSGKAKLPGPSPAFLFHGDPMTPTIASFDVPQEQTYAIRVQAGPFQWSMPDPGALRTATFDRLESGGRPGWSGNLLYGYSLSADSKLHVAAYLDPASPQDDHVQMDRPVEQLDLAAFPYLRITSDVQDNGAEAIAVVASLDLDGDGKADAVWTSPLFTHASSKTDELNILPMVQEEFPGRTHYDIVGIGVRFQKKPHGVWEKTSYAAGLYTFDLADLGLYRAASAAEPGWVWRPAQDLQVGEPAAISQPLDNLDAQRFPIFAEYNVDGPAPLYVDTAITVVAQDGRQKTIPAGSQLLQPFSHGILTLSVRDQILYAIPSGGAEAWTATQAQFSVRALMGKPELRATTFSLGRVGAQWLPGSTMAASNAKEASGATAASVMADAASVRPPVLTLDGQPVTLNEIPGAVDHLLYTTSGLTLSAGRHQIGAAYPGSSGQYAVESIQIEPASGQPVQATPPAISFENINPTRLRVHVTNAQAPYFLVFSDNFHPGWSAFVESYSAPSAASPASEFAAFSPGRWYAQSALLSWLFDGGKRVEIADHHVVNGFANAWWVAATGNYDIVLEFMPQRAYEVGLAVAFATFIAGVLFLIASRLRQR